MRKLIGSLRVMILIGLTLVTVACTQTTPTPPANSTRPVVSVTVVPAATPTPTPTPLVASAANVGPVPQTCPPGPPPTYVNSEVGPGVGSFPVWAIGFAGPRATIHLNGWSEDPSFVQYGWNYKILWVMSDSSPGPVTLRGGSLHDSALLWFQIGDQAPTRSPVLSPSHPDPDFVTVTNSPWTDFPSYIFIPKADCYYLEAQWPGGSWHIPFAAGL
jgi:hypothetical protein